MSAVDPAQDPFLPAGVWHHAGDPDEVPLVYLHGWMGSGADAAFLVAHGWTGPILAPDLPGHGASGAPGRPPLPADSFDEVVDGLRRWLEAQALGVFDLAAYSMGGRLAYGLLPDAGGLEIRHAAILSAHPGLMSPAARPSRQALEAARAKTLRDPALDLRAWLHAWYAQPLFGAIQEASGYDRLIEERCRGSRVGWADALESYGLGSQPYLRGALEVHPGPWMLMAGAQDERYARIMAGMAEMGTASLAIVPDAAHALPVEAPAAITALLRRQREGM